MVTVNKKKLQSGANTTELLNDADRTKADILAVATDEFATKGLSGARVDAIAERTRTSKRMIYYYFGSKEGLYRAVLDQAYANIRSRDSQIEYEAMSPADAIRHMIELTFDYDEDHPQFIRLVNVENIHLGRHIDKLPSIKGRNAGVIRVLGAILARGREKGVFRADVNALDLHMMISAYCFFRVSNRYTFGTVFDLDFSDPATRRRHRKAIVDAILRYLDPRPPSNAT
jgi:AcrR family transcriptional regulator